MNSSYCKPILIYSRSEWCLRSNIIESWELFVANCDSSSLHDVFYCGIEMAFQRLENSSIEMLRPITSVTRQFNDDNGILCSASSTNSMLLWDSCQLQVKSCDLGGPMFFKNVSVNQSFTIPSLIHPESETEKLAPLIEDLSIVDSMS